jgi:O-methyltransferase involved in polyketide biosynthesis
MSVRLRKRGSMNKARLEWVMSGLNQYVLTTAEDLFLKTVLADFDKNQALTERQEGRLEALYKEKSRLIPNKKSDHFAFKESTPRKTRLRTSRGKVS